MIVLDTHTWVWWAADRAKLSKAALAAIESDSRRSLCDVSLREVAHLVQNGKLVVDRDLRDWLEQAVSAAGVTVVPIRPDIATRSVQLGRRFQGDPYDQLIAATAIVESATLVTKDAKLRAYPGLTTVW